MAMQRYDQQNSIQVGQTNLGAGDFVPPRVKVVQAMSAEATADPPLGKVGDLYNTLTGENYGKSLEFIPIQPFKQRVFLVRDERRPTIEEALGAPLSEGNGLKCRSLDMYQGIGEPGILCNECPLAKWGPQNQPPLCTETYNVAAMNELGDLVFLSFAKSSAKVGKRMFSMLRLSHAQPWTKVYSMTTRKQTNDRGTFAVPEVTVTGKDVPPELLRVGQEWARQLTGVVVDVSPVEMDEEEPEPAEAPF